MARTARGRVVHIDLFRGGGPLPSRLFRSRAAFPHGSATPGQRRPCRPTPAVPAKGWLGPCVCHGQCCRTCFTELYASESHSRFREREDQSNTKQMAGTGYASCGNAPADPDGAAGNQARCTASPAQAAQAAPSKRRKARPTPIFIASARLAPTNDGHVPRAHQTKAQLGCLAAACTCGGAEPSRARACAWHPR